MKSLKIFNSYMQQYCVTGKKAYKALRAKQLHFSQSQKADFWFTAEPGGTV